MKLVVVSCLLGLLVSEGLSLGYHEDVGIPEAERIRQAEARSLASRIIGGIDAKWGENPHLAGVLVTLKTGKLSVCGGTLLSSNRVLTAGQCLYDGYNRYSRVQVVVDSLTLFSGYRRAVASVAIHPDFDPLTPANDLAMLNLQYSVNIYRDVMPAVLPSPSDAGNSYVGQIARVSGYGKTSDWTPLGPGQRLQAVSVPVVNWYDCYSAFGSAISSDILCTAGVVNWGESVGACGGDLGGPLVINNGSTNGTNLLIGVISLQSPVGCENGFPTGYMRVTTYLDWILSKL